MRNVGKNCGESAEIMGRRNGAGPRHAISDNPNTLYAEQKAGRIAYCCPPRFIENLGIAKPAVGEFGDWPKGRLLSAKLFGQDALLSLEPIALGCSFGASLLQP
jgi:hypothetical protein